jgi:hypothetical protein
MRAMWRSALPLALLFGLLPSTPAHACKCLHRAEIFPASGAIPPNAVFYVRDKGQKLRLIDERSTPVPLQYEAVGPRWTRLRPSSPLEDGKLYSLDISPEFTEEWGYGKPLAKYQVQGAPDTVAPSPPASAEFGYENGIASRGTTCETAKEGYSVSISKASDDRASAEQLAIAVVSSNATERVLALLPPGRRFIGTNVCLNNFDMRSDRNAVVALRSVDLAGNFSEPGHPIALTGDGKPTEAMPEPAPLVLGMPRSRVLLIAAVLGVLGLSVLGVRRLRR